MNWKMNWKMRKEDIVLVRVCMGCVLPYNCKLIGQGNYTYLSPTGKVTEQYYDYEIKEKDLKDFLDVNSYLLIKYHLLDVEKKKEEDAAIPTSTPTTVRGWTKKTEKTK